MKKISLFLVSVLTLVLTCNIHLQAQKNTTVRQVIIANGGKFESSPPFVDYVTVEAYDLTTLAVNVFNTIYTQSVQDVIIRGNHAYVTAQDSIVLYNIDTYQRIAIVKDSGVNKMALAGNKLIVTKQFPVSRFHTEVLDANNLSLVALIDGIPGDCQGVAVYGDKAYVAMDSGYLGTVGRLAIIDTGTWALNSILDFGASAVGIHSVYAYGGYIFTVNSTPFGAQSVGSITRYDPSNGTFNTNTFSVLMGPGFGTAGNLLYAGMNLSIGSYDFNTQAIVDTTIINFFGTAGGIEIHSVGVDYINNIFYTNLGNRTNFSRGVQFSFTGDSLTSYNTGLNADACAIDFRNPTGINTLTAKEAISVYPNPASNFIGINLSPDASVNEIKVIELTGQTIETRNVQKGESNIRINISEYPSGVYLLSFSTDQGTRVRKFIKR